MIMTQKQLSHNTNHYIDTYSMILNEMKENMRKAFDTHKDEDVNALFVATILPYYQASIKMCENLLRFTTNIDLQNFAQTLLDEQTKIVNAFTTNQVICPIEESPTVDTEKYIKMYSRIASSLFSTLESATIVNSIDCNFIFEMIPHQMGSIELEKNILKYELCEDFAHLLNALIKQQTENIKTLLKFKTKYCRFQ
jgi:uncharacterized protein (DUF305 family)